MIERIMRARQMFRRVVFDLKYRKRFRSEDFDTTLRCDSFHNFRFGKRCYIGPGCHFDALGGIELADYVIVGPHVRIWSYNHDFRSEMVPYGPKNTLLPVRIGKGAWIGLQALILPGSQIGEGSIVGAGAIVRGIIPPHSIVRPAYSVAKPLAIKKREGTYYRAGS